MKRVRPRHRIRAPRAGALAHAPTTCTFCREAAVAPGVLTETTHFTVVCDRSPLHPGHLLLLSRAHLACYAALPRGLRAEFTALKARVSAFLSATYGPPVFLERGLYGQAMPHAHLHAVPQDQPTSEAPLGGGLGVSLRGWAGLRRWFERRGPYLYLERDQERRILWPSCGAEHPWPAPFVVPATRPPPPEQVPEITRQVREALRGAG